MPGSVTALSLRRSEQCPRALRASWPRRPPYPAEFRERAVRMVFEHDDEYPSQWKAIQSISAKLKVNHESLRQWVRKVETDAGSCPGLTTDVGGSIS